MNYKHFFRKNNHALAVLVSISALILPFFLNAALICGQYGTDCLVPCGFGSGTSFDACSLSDLIVLADNVIYFALFYLAAPLAVLSLAIGGLLMITARGDTGQLQRGKDIFYNTVIGFVVAFGAWLIVEAVITALVPESGTAFTKLKDYISL